MESVAACLYRMQIGDPDAPSLLAAAGHEMRTEALACVPAGKAPFPMEDIRISTQGDRTVVLIPFHEGERLYGCGLSYQKLNRTYEVIHLRTDHYGGRDNGRTHAAVPFYVSSEGYGVFLDTPVEVSFYLGGTVCTDDSRKPQARDRTTDPRWTSVTPGNWVEISFRAPGAVLYLINGASAADTVRAFNLLCGGGCMPPKWGLGFWSRLHTKADADAVRREVGAYRERGIPLSVLGLEPGWQNYAYPCSYDWSEERFAGHNRLTRDLLDQGIRLNLWENMFVSPASTLYDSMLPYAGSHQVWNGIVPDYTLPEARAVYQARHAELAGEGISGFKLDECDGYDRWLWPDHASFPSGSDAVAYRGMCGLLLQRMIDEVYRARGERTYGLVRASSAGGCAFPFCIYNDCYAFSEFLTGLASAALCGVLWAPEVRDAKTPDEWLRRFQLAAVSPLMMLNAWASGAKPWKFPEVTEGVKEAIRLRYRLLPHLYTAFYLYYAKGEPPFRPLLLEGGDYSGQRDVPLSDTENPYALRQTCEVVDQILVGRGLMAAPIAPGQTSRTVVLPAGGWYDFYTGERVCGQTLTLNPVPDHLPLYVREGTVLALQEEDGLCLCCFGESGEGLLYDDDGTGRGYEEGAFYLAKVSFRRRGGVTEHRVTVLHNGYPAPRITIR